MTFLRMLQWPREVENMLLWLDTIQPSRIVEIGTGPGGLTELFCQHASQVISIDLPLGATSGLSLPECVKRNDWLSRTYPGFVGVLGNSHEFETRAAVVSALDGMVDFLFIDGDHYYDGVRADYLDYRTLVRPGGWVGFHDINAKTFGPEVEVHRLWDELVGEKLVWSVDGAWGGIGVIQQ